MTDSSIFNSLRHILLTGAFILSLFASNASVSAAPRAGAADFLITVYTMNPGTSSTFQFTIPTIGSGYNFNIDCNNDGKNESTGHHGSYTCNYKMPGTYTIRISDHSGAGTGFPRIYFNNSGDAEKLLSVDQWGSGKWTSMAGAFWGCSFMTLNAADVPDLSRVADMSYMFAGTYLFNTPIGTWNVSNVTNMASLFSAATIFNQPLSSWNVSNVTNMAGMFAGANAFNQPIGNWDLSKVTDMRGMLAAQSFNQPIGGWNVSNVRNMNGMFNYAKAFNQPIGSWNTSNVTDMSGLFWGATAFNQDIGSWDTSKVTDMSKMFWQATAFDQPIGSWNTSNVGDMSWMFAEAMAFDQNLGAWKVGNLTNAAYMFSGAKLSIRNYDYLLIGWDAQSLHSGISFDAGKSQYCHGAAARDHLVIADGWRITDKGYNCNLDFIIQVKTDNPGISTSTQFTIPTTGSGYNYNVDCDNDGTNEATGLTGEYTCNYGTPGTYWVRISDNTGLDAGFPRIYFNGGGDKDKLLIVSQWGTLQWTSMAHAFEGCTNMNLSPAAGPVLTHATDLSYMFANDTSISDPERSHFLDYWDVSHVTDMSYMFSGASTFNMPMNWNVSHVTNMEGMFENDTSFLQDLSPWDTSQVTNMSWMFAGDYHFGQPLGSWNTSNVSDMSHMFDGDAWFDSDLSNWDTSKVRDMSYMFRGTDAYKRDVSRWNVDSLTNAEHMFDGVTLATGLYDALLNGWGAQPLKHGVVFDADNSTYCIGAAARDRMISQYGWTINDGGKDICDEFIIEVKTDVPQSTSKYDFTVQTTGSGYDYTVDCNNDGIDEVQGATGNYTCIYKKPGTYQVRISDHSGLGTGFSRIYFDGTWDNYKMMKVLQWGSGKWTSFANAFQGCWYLNMDASDVPDLSNVTDMSFMFDSATSLNQPIVGWDTSHVTNMRSMFAQEIHFNQPLVGWDTSNVTDMSSMFVGATLFNQPIGNWNVSKVTDMSNMFHGDSAFNQDISAWNVGSLSNADHMFNGAKLSTANYDALLKSWDAQLLHNGVVFDGGNSTYCAGEASRADMISHYGWTITDGGKYCSTDIYLYLPMISKN